MNIEPTVFVVDDDAAIREAMGFLLESVGLNSEIYASADDFLNHYEPSRPGCLVLDLRMPGTSGLALQELLAERRIQIPIIFFTAHGDVPSSVRAMKAQAFDFIQKPFNDQDLLDRIYDAISREGRNRGEREKIAAIEERVATLTPREREIMKMIVDGKPSKRIASELNISEKTVHTHRARIMDKMQADSLAALVRMDLAVG